jgi:flagellar biosynthetic protein FliP
MPTDRIATASIALALLGPGAGALWAQAPAETGAVADALESTLNEGSYARLVLLIAAVSLTPIFLAVVTPFARIAIALYFLRSGFGSQQIPPNPVLLGLAILLSALAMRPTLQQVHGDAAQPLLEGEITLGDALARGEQPLRDFMFGQVRNRDLALMVNLARLEDVKVRADVPTSVLIPAFVVGELYTAFLIGLVIYLPFLVIDLAVSGATTAVGLGTLSPALVSLPFKLLLFVMVDGWHLLTGALVQSFG